MRRAAKQHLDNIWSEDRRNEDLEWLQCEGDELIRLHKKLKNNRILTTDESAFLADVVYFALGESIRVDDESAAGKN